jgi:hypothetical protein
MDKPEEGLSDLVTAILYQVVSRFPYDFSDFARVREYPRVTCLGSGVSKGVNAPLYATSFADCNLMKRGTSIQRWRL